MKDKLFLRISYQGFLHESLFHIPRQISVACLFHIPRLISIACDFLCLNKWLWNCCYSSTAFKPLDKKPFVIYQYTIYAAEMCLNTSQKWRDQTDLYYNYRASKWATIRRICLKPVYLAWKQPAQIVWIRQTRHMCERYSCHRDADANNSAALYPMIMHALCSGLD